MAAVIKKVDRSSPFRKEISSGDSLLKINDNLITDVFDYNFYLSEEEENTFLFLTKKGEVSLSLKAGKDAGLEFDTYLMDKEHSCKNKCIFCFIDQLPKGLRKSLYFKDDDSRLSFLFGNYITLTNLKEEDVRRIGKMHISPINISVHTTDPALRVEMMKNKNAGEALNFIPIFYKQGTYMNCQIVLCRGINDGEHLNKTIRDLSEYFPTIESISVVPAGLTKYREGLFPLTPYDKKSAGEIIDIVEGFGDEFLKKFGERMVYPSDELFITAEREIPEIDYYGSFHQLENGVGMVRLFIEEFETILKNSKKIRIKNAIFITGTLFYPFLKSLLDKVNERFGSSLKAVPIKNEFLGESITVAGLLAGQDIIKQLSHLSGKEPIVLTNCMLKQDEDIFLDDVSLKELSKALKRKVIVVGSDGSAVAKAILK
jgi:putative radical SAM enzyme (TIGR03279 family)